MTEAYDAAREAWVAAEADCREKTQHFYKSALKNQLSLDQRDEMLAACRDAREALRRMLEEVHKRDQLFRVLIWPSPSS